MTSAVLTSLDSFKCRRTLKVGKHEYEYFDLKAAEKAGLSGIGSLPFSLKVLLENLLRHEDGRSVTSDDIRAVAEWVQNRRSDREIAFRPARVLMQDFTGVPAVVDLAAMRDAVAKLGGDSAVEEADYLSKFGSTVYMVHRRDQLRHNGGLLGRGCCPIHSEHLVGRPRGRDLRRVVG